MENSVCSNYWQDRDYIAPACRIIACNPDLTFLASNLEPIGGGDDPDIDW